MNFWRMPSSVQMPRLADESAAAVILVGDRHQLPAVGRGGGLDLAARYAPARVTQLDQVRRFTDPTYAALSLQMRLGESPGDVFDELLHRGNIVVHASDVERRQALAVRATHGDLVVADTREQVTIINGLARQVRKATGDVTDGVVTAAGERIGAGDKIATRRNDPTHRLGDKGMAVATAALEAPVAPRRGPSIVADLLPHPRDVVGWRDAAAVARGSRQLAPGLKLSCRV